MNFVCVLIEILRSTRSYIQLVTILTLKISSVSRYISISRDIRKLNFHTDAKSNTCYLFFTSRRCAQELESSQTDEIIEHGTLSRVRSRRSKARKSCFREPHEAREPSLLLPPAASPRCFPTPSAPSSASMALLLPLRPAAASSASSRRRSIRAAPAR